MTDRITADGAPAYLEHFYGRIQSLMESAAERVELGQEALERRLHKDLAEVNKVLARVIANQTMTNRELRSTRKTLALVSSRLDTVQDAVSELRERVTALEGANPPPAPKRAAARLVKYKGGRSR